MALLSRQPSQAIETAVTLWGGQRAAQRPPCSDGHHFWGHDSGSIYGTSTPGPRVWLQPAFLSPHTPRPWVHIPSLVCLGYPQSHSLAVLWVTAEKLECACSCLPVTLITTPSVPRALPTHRWLSHSSGRAGIPAPGPAFLLSPRPQVASWSPGTERGPRTL